MSVTRITHQAAIRLGLAQSVTKAYQVRLKLSGEPRFVLRRGSRDAGMRQVEERTEGRKSPPAGRDHRVVGLEQGAAVCDERVDNPGTDAPGGDRTCYQVAPGREGTRHPARCEGRQRHGQVPQTRVEKRAGNRRPRRLPSQGAVARKAEGPAGPQGSGLDVRAVREDRQDQRGHLHEGDVRHNQGAVNHPALSRCEAGTEG
jgi:hypothetical protein